MKKFNKKSLVTVLSFSLILGLVVPLAVLAAGPAIVNLGTAGNFVILAKTGISSTGTTAIVGDIGVSPAEATYITGNFALDLPASGAFSTSVLVTGKVYAPSYAVPTPAYISTAVSDMETAYTDAAGRASTVTELGAGNIGGLTLVPGVYKWGTGVTIPTDVTLSGGANDVWIFQIAQNLDISSATKVVLAGGAQASNIFWVVAGQTTIGTTAVMNGNILDQTTIVLNTGATLNGRALAQAAVTLDSNVVTIPSGASVPPTPTPTPVPASSSSNSTGGSSNSNTTTTSDTGCVSGNKFSITTGHACASFVENAAATVSTASAFGQQVKMIATDLRTGSRGNNVSILQRFLISQDKGSAAQSLAKVGATAYFGSLTRVALAEFQADVGIRPALGNFGPITREYLDTH